MDCSVRKENLVMGGQLPTHIVHSGEKNWHTLWWRGEVDWVISVIVFHFICIYMQNSVSSHWACQWCLRMCIVSFQVLILCNGWSRIWTLKIKVKERNWIYIFYMGKDTKQIVPWKWMCTILDALGSSSFHEYWLFSFMSYLYVFILYLMYSILYGYFIPAFLFLWEQGCSLGHKLQPNH